MFIYKKNCSEIRAAELGEEIERLCMTTQTIS